MIYHPRFTGSARESILRLPPEIKKNVREAVRFLCRDPLAGEPLRRELEGKRKFRIGRYRIIYQLEPSHKIIVIVAVGHRRHIYESGLAVQD